MRRLGHCQAVGVHCRPRKDPLSLRGGQLRDRGPDSVYPSPVRGSEAHDRPIRPEHDSFRSERFQHRLDVWGEAFLRPGMPVRLGHQSRDLAVHIRSPRQLSYIFPPGEKHAIANTRLGMKRMTYRFHFGQRGDAFELGHNSGAGGVIYDGVWVGEKSKIPNQYGIRSQLVDMMKQIHVPIIRWPGGCFADSYDWKDGIGEASKRPRRTNFWEVDHDAIRLHDKGPQLFETNEFGTNEFIRFCQLTGAQPYLAANLRSLPALDFDHWVEYCNSPAGSTTLAEVRAAAGFPEPFNVRYWGIEIHASDGTGTLEKVVF